MLKNFIKVAVRNLIKQRFYSLINILGLAFGMAVCLLIGFYVSNEVSYDRFHSKADRIYRILTYAKVGESEFKGAFTSPGVMKPIMAEIPEIEDATRMDLMTDQIIKVGDKSVTEPKTLAVDAGFLKVFDFQLLQGNPETALVEPFSALLTEASAQRIYGSTDVLNKTFVMNDKEFKITGVIEEAPSNTHFHYGIIFSLNSLTRKHEITNWGNLSLLTYLVLKKDTDIAQFESKLNSLIPKYFEDYEDFKKTNATWEMSLQPVIDVHLYSHYTGELEPGGDIKYVYIFISVAIFIVIIACINFMNMATARSVHRAKEVGIRKVMGSYRQTLIGQFLSEAILMSLLAAILAVGLVELVKGSFNELSGKTLEMNILNSPSNLLMIGIFALVVGLAAGIYPAFYLTSFQPVQVLKGTFKSGKGSVLFRNSLVVFQFVISVTLIVCTFVVNSQLQFMSEKKLGFEKENVIVVSNIDKLKDRKASFLEALENQSGVSGVSHSKARPFGDYDATYFALIGKEDEGQIFNFTYVGNDFVSTMGMEMLLGRQFSEEFTDTASVIFNEAAVLKLAIEGDPIGREVEIDGNDFTIVGVVKDFHFQSLHTPILPMALIKNDYTTNAFIRIGAGNYHQAITDIENTWKQFTNGEPFSYSFVDQEFDSLFKSEQKLSSLFISFTSLAIFIACLGLFALSAFMAEQRTKEIGVRKVLGASTTNLLIMLSKDFTKLIVIAIVLASPLAYFMMNYWLEDFAYRVNINLWIFGIAAILALVLAWITVSFQSLKAAGANPVDSLKSE